jgi:hypothetical protein
VNQSTEEEEVHYIRSQNILEERLIGVGELQLALDEPLGFTLELQLGYCKDINASLRLKS